MASSFPEELGWIGTGVMGTSMCGHLIDAGYASTVYNRTRAQAEPLLDRGARMGRHAGAGRRRRRRGLHDGRLPGRRARGDPRRARGAGRRAAGHRARRHDDERALAGAGDRRRGREQRRPGARCARSRAATSGRRNATLSIMVGGDAEALERGAAAASRPWARRSSTRAGRAPGQHTKMVNQILIATA